MRPLRLFIFLAVVFTLWLHCALAGQGITVVSDEETYPVKGLVFSSKDCELCRATKAYLNSLEKALPVSFKALDIQKPHNYKIFHRLETIHGTRAFSVPMVIVGENVFIGPREIKSKLGKTILRLSRNGGAKLPYLGPPLSRRSVRHAPREDNQDCGCERGRPPSAREELARLGRVLDWLF